MKLIQSPAKESHPEVYELTSLAQRRSCSRTSSCEPSVIAWMDSEDEQASTKEFTSASVSNNPISPSLLTEWTQIQLDQASQAIYADPSWLRVSGTFTSPTVYDPLEATAHDYDAPMPACVDSATIWVQGVKHVAGIDVSYDTDSDLAIVALAVMSYPDLQVKHTFLERVTPSQPYVPSFLSMRELQHVAAIYDKVIQSIPETDRPDIIFVDGYGRWHERQAGLATALGVERGLVTIGVGKEYQPLRPDLGGLLALNAMPVPMPPWPETDHFRAKQKTFREYCREHLRSRGQFLGVPLHRDGPLVGAAVYSAPGKPKRNLPPPSPIYISPGNHISLGSAIALTLTCCTRAGVRQPEPIVVADRLGRDELARLGAIRASSSIKA